MTPSARATHFRVPASTVSAIRRRIRRTHRAWRIEESRTLRRTIAAWACRTSSICRRRSAGLSPLGKHLAHLRLPLGDAQLLDLASNIETRSARCPDRQTRPTVPRVGAIGRDDDALATTRAGALDPAVGHGSVVLDLAGSAFASQLQSRTRSRSALDASSASHRARTSPTHLDLAASARAVGGHRETRHKLDKATGEPESERAKGNGPFGSAGAVSRCLP